MAITELYIQTTGNDMNAGSTTADAASVTSTNGSWDITADTFIATGGTPFSGVTAGVDWVSIYNDGVTTGAVYVALVDSLYLSGLGVVLSTTQKYGTKPAAGATGKSAKVGGAWASLAVLTSLFPSVALAQSTRVNLKAGTYANTTTSRTLGSAGAATIAALFRGYNTTIGDVESDNSLTKPVITFTTGRLIVTGAYWGLSNLDISGAQTTNGQLVLSGQFAWADRCRVECTAANSAGAAVAVATASEALISRSWLKATSSADVIFSSHAGAFVVDGCTLKGGLHGIRTNTSAVFLIFATRFDGQAGDMVRVTGGGARVFLLLCTGYNATSDALEVTAGGQNLYYIAHNLFSVVGGYGINNSSGTNSNNIRRLGNSFYSITSGQANGLGDAPALAPQTESSQPLTNPGSQDFSLLAAALAKGLGLPGGYENLTDRSYLDAGAVQRQEAGGGLLKVGAMTGGMQRS